MGVFQCPDRARLFLLAGLLAACVTSGADIPVRYESQKLVASDGVSGDLFGRPVALSDDTALVGAPGDDANGDSSGSAYVFVRDKEGQWHEQEKLRASDGAAGDWFGTWVAIDNDIVVIGAPGDDDNGENSGSAYAFVRNEAGEWVEEAKLLPAGGAAGDRFGSSVAVTGETAMVGAPFDNEQAVHSGAAYVFVRETQRIWREQDKLLPDAIQNYDMFGHSIAVDGETAVVGTPGELNSGFARVYERDAGGIWRVVGTLFMEHEECCYEEDLFGSPLALSGDTILVGQAFEHSAHLFVRDSSGAWEPRTVLSDGTGTPDDPNRNWLALDGDLAIVGSEGDDVGGSYYSGSVLLYYRAADSQWTLRVKLVPSDGTEYDFFGHAVAIHGDTVLIGAPWSSGGWGAGAVYVFELHDLRGSPNADQRVITVADVNGNSTADVAVTTQTDEGAYLACHDGADGTAIGVIDIGDQEVHLLATLADVSANGLDEIMALTIEDDGKRVVRLFDSSDGTLINEMPFGHWFYYPVALLALGDGGGGLAGPAAAVIQPNREGRALAISRYALTGQKLNTVRYGLTIGRPIGAASIADLNGNAVEEIAVFGETHEGRAKVQIRDALTGEKISTLAFDDRFAPLLVAGIPSINGDASDELVMLGANALGGVRFEVKDSLSKQRLATRWLRRVSEELPLAMGYLDHPEGPALAVLTEGVDGKYRARIKRLTSSEPGWLVSFPLHKTPHELHDFAVLADTSGNLVPELLVIGKNRRGIVKVLAHDAETGEELFRTTVP